MTIKKNKEFDTEFLKRTGRLNAEFFENSLCRFKIVETSAEMDSLKKEFKEKSLDEINLNRDYVFKIYRKEKIIALISVYIDPDEYTTNFQLYPHKKNNNSDALMEECSDDIEVFEEEIDILVYDLTFREYTLNGLYDFHVPVLGDDGIYDIKAITRWDELNDICKRSKLLEQYQVDNLFKESYDDRDYLFKVEKDGIPVGILGVEDLGVIQGIVTSIGLNNENFNDETTLNGFMFQVQMYLEGDELL